MVRGGGRVSIDGKSSVWLNTNCLLKDYQYIAGILLSCRVEAKTFGRDKSQSLRLNFTEIQQEFNLKLSSKINLVLTKLKHQSFDFRAIRFLVDLDDLNKWKGYLVLNFLFWILTNCLVSRKYFHLRIFNFYAISHIFFGFSIRREKIFYQNVS